MADRSLFNLVLELWFAWSDNTYVPPEMDMLAAANTTQEHLT